MNIAILDYQMGNIHSIQYALTRLGVVSKLTNSPKGIFESDALILPGVGNATTVMRIIHNNNLEKTILDFKRPVLGICLGMQILCQFSEEGNQKCLGIFPYTVHKFSSKNLCVPQIGWNSIQTLHSKSLTHNLQAESQVYYANSYFVPKNKHTLAYSNYGVELSAELQKDNYWGLQFHPEKSGKIGVQILQNFLTIVKAY